MAAYRERSHGRVLGLVLAIYLGAALGLLGMILWRLWTEVLGAWPT